MPKYSEDKIFGHYLYFTSHCTIEAMHVHVGNEELSEIGSAKFFVRADGSSVMKQRGDLTRKEQIGVRKYIKKHYKTMYAKWCRKSKNGYFVSE